MKSELHCGACMKAMIDTDELTAHLKTCEASKALLYPLTWLMFSWSDPGHKVSHLASASSQYAHVIREYAAAVAGDEMTSFQRSQIHQRLCQRLGLEYADFRPFESEDIIELPTVQEAEDIIWKAIGAELRKRIAECK